MAAASLVLLLASALVWRYYHLQVENHSYYAAASEDNRVHVRPVPPVRGLIHDRNGVLLADNRPSFILKVVKERAGDLDQLLDRLRHMVAISDQQVEQFKKRLSRRQSYEAIPLRYNLSEREQSVLAVDAHRLPGVEVAAEVVRNYPQKEMLAHVLGYVSRISEKDLDNRDKQHYRGTDVIGKRGLEYFYEDTLLGQVGSENVETNTHGRVMRLLERTDPVAGKDLQLFIDSRLQQVAVEAMAGERGSVVALDTKTGGVLAMVSAPGYDTNLFVTGISHQNYNALRDSLDKPLLNRTLHGTYSPASTVKPVYGLAALESGQVTANTTIYDPGYFQLPNEERKYRDWKKRGHGHKVDLKQAIVESCDTYFYQISHEMGIDKLSPFGDSFGLGQPTGIDMTGEKSGIMPSRAWKEGVRGIAWYPGDTINTSIGQGFTTVTPLQLAVMTMRLANRGESRQPRLVKSIGGVSINLEPPQQYVRAQSKHWDTVQGAMEAVMHGRHGTGRAIATGLKYRMAGKTGTAQLVGIAEDAEYDSEIISKSHRDNALFIGYAPADNPQIAVAVIIENGEKSSLSATVARKIMDAWLLEYSPELLIADGDES